MKSLLLAAAAMLLAPVSARAATPDPVGTWVITLTGSDEGIAYATFSADRRLTGYGLSRDSRGLFTLSGSWTADASGGLSLSYLEQINGGTVTGALTGRLANGQITGVIVATNGNFKVRARPQAATQVMTGTWSGVASIGGLRLPEIYQITPGSRPNVYDIIGTGMAPGGQFAILGTAIVGAGGKVRVVVASQYAGGSSTYSSLSGTFNAAARVNALRGSEAGKPLQVVLRR